jgi:hypothetical protein
MDWLDIAIKVVTFLGVVGAFLASLKNRAAIQEVHLSLNSRLSELIEVAKTAAHAEGVAQGRAEEKHPPPPPG